MNYLEYIIIGVFSFCGLLGAAVIQIVHIEFEKDIKKVLEKSKKEKGKINYTIISKK